MSVDERKTLLKIRTFAQDQRNQQSKTGQPATEETVTPKKETGGGFETPKMSAPKATTHTVTVEKKSAKKPESKITQPAAPKKIPAFHELQKEANNTISVRPRTGVKKSSKETHTPKKRDHHFTSTTTIITDNKKTGGDFFGNLATSIDNWFISLKKKFKKKREPKYIVQDTTRRKGVIQKATTKTGTLFTADNETLREEIRRRRLQEKQSGTGDPEITWSPNTEVGYALLGDPKTAQERTQNVQVSFKKHSVPEPTREEAPDTRWESASNEVVETPLPTSTPAPTVSTYETAPITTKEESRLPIETETPPSPIESVVSSDEDAVPTEEIETTLEVPEAESEEEYIPEETEETTPSESVLTSGLNLLRGKTSLRNTNTNVITIWATAIIAMVIIIFVIAKGVVGILNPETTTVAVTEPATPILNGATLVDFTLSDYSNSALTQAINQSDAVADSNLTEIRFLDNTEQPLRSQAVIDLLGFTINPNFNQSVDELHLVSINHTEHAIVFVANDPTTVFGALLTWEPEMASDLAPVLDIPNVSAEARFVDKTILQSDVRILIDNEKEILVYGFLDKNTVLITTNTDSFTRIAENQR